jgi:hypothetical protein
MANIHDQIPSVGDFAAYRKDPLSWYLSHSGVLADHEDCPEWARRVSRYDRDQFIDRVGVNRYRVGSVFPSALAGSGEGKKSLNHLHVMQQLPKAYSGTQDYNNCRSWSMKFSSMTVLGMDIASGDLHRAETQHGTALVYGSRQSGSDSGMTMSRGCEVVTSIGQSEVKDYGFVNLSAEKDDESYGLKWGRSGPPQQLIDAVKGDQVERAYHVDEPTPAIIKDLFYNQATIDTGSSVTGSGPGNPLVGLRSIGGHAQAATGYDDTDECRARLNLKAGESVVFMQQSWGSDWIQINSWPEDLWGPRPEGCWPITMTNFLKLIRGWDDAWAIVGIKGFAPRRLPDWGSVLYL